MDDAPRVERFLEPLYLNESMALNCAAYLFSGVTLESTDTSTTEAKKALAVKAGLPFLAEFIGLSGSMSNSTVQEQQAARKFTVGGLHMNVLDALHEKNMVTTITEATDDQLDRSAILDKYVHVQAILRPSDYYALLTLIGTLGPLLVPLATEYGEALAERSNMTNRPWADIQSDIERHSDAALETVQKLDADYLTSGQLEMVMWSSASQRLGIVDLDVDGHNPKALKAKLSGPSGM